MILRDLGGTPAHAVARQFRSGAIAGLVDAVASYDTVGLYFESVPLETTEIEGTLASLEKAKGAERKTHRVPVCYEFGPDLVQAATTLGLATDALVTLHSSIPYDCFAIGFCPGFPYLGYLPDSVAGLPRLPQPRTRVEPGSVGITGRQTGIYPLATPGGWWLIGRTPLEVVSVEDDYFPIEAGDIVSFFRIDDAEFARIKGERL